MEQTQSFIDQLFQAVMDRQQMFDSFLLPKLQEEFRISQSSAKTIRTVLVKKGILHDDPYKYDSKVSEIELPPDDPFTESEKSGVIGRRLSQYESMLDFMNNYYQFTCDFLTTERISRLVALNKSFSWESFSNTSSKVNTKGLSDLVNTLRNGGDPLSISIINDSLAQLSRSSIAITKTLKTLSEFHRERYKLAVRKLVLPGAEVSPDCLSSGPSSAIREIKQSFAITMKEQPFYTELIEEILKEEFSPEKAVLQQDLLSRLALTRTDTGKKAVEESLKPVLMDGIRTIGSASPQLDAIASKLMENQSLLLSLEKGFLHKLSRMLRKAFNKPEIEQEMAITTVDPVSQTKKRENIIFLPFIEDLKKRSRIYTGFTLRTSAAYQKIELMDEKQIIDLLTRHVAELGNLLKECNGLDEYFKQAATPEIRERIRGIRVEISAIRNSLVKANQCRAEYASQVEEQQQLKKLGITNV